MAKVPGVHAPNPGGATRVVADGRPVAVFNLGGQLRAVDALCTHAGGPIDKGAIDGDVVTCPLHGSRFNLVSGAVLQGPARRPLRVYRVTDEVDGLSVEGMQSP